MSAPASRHHHAAIKFIRENSVAHTRAAAGRRLWAWLLQPDDESEKCETAGIQPAVAETEDRDAARASQ